jgi:hypothetical protein
MGPLYRRLHFPDRAENIGQFSAYQIHLAHWRPLSDPFEDAFTAVYERGSSALLLIHGAQGSGKTLFCDRLEQDFEQATQGSLEPRHDNLWHTLVGGAPMRRDTIEKATAGTALRRARPVEGWLAAERKFATGDKRYKVRLFLLDDAHHEVFLSELAKVSLDWFRARPRREAETGVLGTLAENLVFECRNDFQRSLFVFTSNRADLMAALHDEIERSHARLSRVQELPLPAAPVKEAIVRTNTNRFNNVSYWYCLDMAGPAEKERVYQVLHAQKGFTDSFLAVDDALKSSARVGRPASRNVITLVTLGAELRDVDAFLADHDIESSEEHVGEHLRVWYAREQWASQIAVGANAERTRRAELVQSEFSLRWFALDRYGAYALCQPPGGSSPDLGEHLLDAISLFPSFSRDEQARQRAQYKALDLMLASSDEQQVQAWGESFRNLGQRRNAMYEPAIAARVQGYGRGLSVFPAVRPDVIAQEYTTCAVTTARSPSEIGAAIRRSCHAVEFTAFLGNQMTGIEDYLVDKIERYALLLESV